jgi:hypothetical protein
MFSFFRHVTFHKCASSAPFFCWKGARALTRVSGDGRWRPEARPRPRAARAGSGQRRGRVGALIDGHGALVDVRAAPGDTHTSASFTLDERLDEGEIWQTACAWLGRTQLLIINGHPWDHARLRDYACFAARARHSVCSCRRGSCDAPRRLMR